MSDITNLIEAYDEQYFCSLNLVASENCSSKAVRNALSSDLHHRYAIPPEDKRPPGLWDYPNQTLVHKIIERTEQLACQVYHADQANVFPLSGNQIAQIMLLNFLTEGEAFLSVGADCGGHFTTAKIAERSGFRQIDLPYDRKNGCIHIEKTADLVKRENIRFIFLDASMILFPYPLAELRAATGDDVVISYDGSHTLGVIGGKQFQSPLEEGADFLHGSTHKSLWGPQKGMILTKTSKSNIERAFRDMIPFFVSNVHVHHIAALGIALEEIQGHGTLYAETVVNNARSLAKTMDDAGLRVLFGDKGYTACHQVIVSIGDKKTAITAFENLQKAGINTNAIRIPFSDDQTFGLRIGLAELTRRGLKADAMETIARCIAAVLFKTSSLDDIADQVKELSQQYTNIHFC